MEFLPLTKEGIKAMKAADRVAIHCQQETGAGTLTLIREATVGGYQMEGKQGIDCEAFWTLYITPHKEDCWHKAFFYLGTPAQDGSWQALCHILRAGDILSLRVIAGNNGESTNEAHLYHDYLQANIWRNDRMLIRGMYLDDSLCPDNSARAVQVATRK